jgi:hypothetical protein
MRMNYHQRLKDLKAGKYTIPEGQLCEYGCGQPAKFILAPKWKVEKYCCSSHYKKCPSAQAAAKKVFSENYRAKTGFDHPLQQVEKIRATRKQKYGVDHHMKVPEIMAQKKATCVERYGAPQGFTEEQHQANVRAKYGVDNVFQLPEVVAKLRQTNLERYGAELAFSSPEFVQAYRNGYYQKTGFTHPLCNGAAGRKKAIETTLGRYGVEYSMQSEEVKERVRLSCLEHFGVPHHFQNAEFFNSVKTDALFKRKSYVLPSGKEIKLQGYEPQVLDELLKQFSEDEFEFARKPSFSYTDASGKKRRYHPDFVLPGKRILYEVKGQYWYEHDYDTIYRKAAACVAIGWNVFVVVSKDGKVFSWLPFVSLPKPH